MPAIVKQREMLRLCDVQKRLRIAPNSIRKLVARGILSEVRVPHSRPRYFADEIDDLVQRSTKVARVRSGA
jgi:hypothetical protein